MSGAAAEGGKGGGRGRGGNRGRSARRSRPAPKARGEAGSEEQPMSGIEHEAVEEIAGFWTGGKPGEKYQVTEDWKVLKEDVRGTKSYDLFWDYESGIVKWGDTFFFDPVDLYQSVDTLHWYRQSDTEKQEATHTWTRSRDAFADFGAGKQPKTIAKQGDAPPAPRSSSRKKGPKEDPVVDPQQLVVQRSDGGLRVKAGDMLRVVSVRGGTIVLEAGSAVVAASGGAAPKGAAQEQLKASTSAAEKHVAKPAAKSVAKAVAKSVAKPLPVKVPAKGPPSTKPGKVVEKTQLPGSQPTDGDGAEVLDFIVGLWAGAKGETYNLTADWSCTKTEKRGKETVFANLCWDEERGFVLWGSSYMFDAADLEAVDETGELDWYRQADEEKSNPIFTWVRQEA